MKEAATKAAIDESDAALIERVQGGETGCFAELVRRYRPALLRVARSRLGRADWAEDAVQETFLAAFKSRHTYRPQFSFRTWLWTILLNQCRGIASRQNRHPRVFSWTDELQTSQSQTAFPPSAPGEGLARDEQAPWQPLVARERAEALEHLLARLSPVQADALRLRFFGGLKFHEIAAAMNCSLGTAKNRVHWGLMQLSEWLTESEGQGGRASSLHISDD